MPPAVMDNSRKGRLDPVVDLEPYDSRSTTGSSRPILLLSITAGSISSAIFSAEANISVATSTCQEVLSKIL
jgi:hypothetical protein